MNEHLHQCSFGSKRFCAKSTTAIPVLCTVASVGSVPQGGVPRCFCYTFHAPVGQRSGPLVPEQVVATRCTWEPLSDFWNTGLHRCCTGARWCCHNLNVCTGVPGFAATRVTNFLCPPIATILVGNFWESPQRVSVKPVPRIRTAT